MTKKGKSETRIDVNDGRNGRVDEVLQRVGRMAATGHYDQALAVLNAAGRDGQILNAKGVCLLRLQKPAEAMRIYRELVLSPGCTWMRPHLPITYKSNYATSLLLSGHPSGCLEILAELNDESLDVVKQLRAAMKRWESSLSFWQKLNWRFGNIEPSNRPVSIDFEPGQ
mgnify:FL=1